MRFQGGNIRIIKEGDKINLYDGVNVEIYETPGHHPSCVCFKLNNYLFTGDSFIPGVRVVTKLKGGNRIQAADSVSRIISMIDHNTILCPGHGEMFTCLPGYD